MSTLVNSELDPNIILPNYRRWLYAVAAELLFQHRLVKEVDDIAQEGYIAMWKALRTYDKTKGALPGYLTQAARWRMIDVAIKFKPQTGEPSIRGHTREKAAFPVDYQDAYFMELIGVEEILQDITIAYHQGEIYEAISSLSPAYRDLVYRRFWLGTPLTSKEHYHWNSNIKNTLADKLAHLAGIV